MKTTLHIIIDDLKKLKSGNDELTPEQIITILEDNLPRETKQIHEAFKEGIKYGKSDFQPFDSPHGRYYSEAYEETSIKIYERQFK